MNQAIRGCVLAADSSTLLFGEDEQYDEGCLGIGYFFRRSIRRLA